MSARPAEDSGILHAVHELQEAFAWDVGLSLVYDLRAVLPDDPSNVVGYLLRGIVGYNAAPTVLEGVAYLAYWFVLILIYLGIRTGKISVVAEPMARVWRSLTGRERKAPVQNP